MANTKAEPVVEEPIDRSRPVQYTAPIDMRNLNETRYASVNGANCRIKAGETVMIPEYFASVLRRQDQNNIAIQRRIQHVVSNPAVIEAN